MTQEEKAKAYDEALKRAEAAINIAADKDLVKGVATTIFPELRESEDERIRKEIKDIVLSYRNNCVYEGNHHFDECLDWLEKQKEQKPNPTEDMPYITVGSILKLAEEELLKGFVVQKPEQITDSEIKESMDAVTNFKVFAADLAKTFNITHQRDIDWHNFCAGLLTYLERNKPAEWSEEDEKMLKRIEAILLTAEDDLSDKLNGKVSPITDSAYSSMKLCIAKCLSWLKSLRPQKLDASKLENFDPVEVLNKIKTEWPMAWEKVVGKQEWSEEDEEMRQGCIASVEYELLDNGRDDEVETDPRIVWLKSLPLNLKKKNEDVAKLCSNEWSEEDENKIESIKGLITMGRFADANTVWTIWNLLDSLRPSWKLSEVCYGAKGDPDPAGVWKPSEEQMNALNALNCHGDLSYVGQQNQLISLYNDLKKLKG